MQKTLLFLCTIRFSGLFTALQPLVLLTFKKLSLFVTSLFLPFAVHAEQFISLTLCSDRLLLELARSEQIAAQSPFSKNPLAMLDKVNADKPTLEPRLTALLPYLDKTVLINENFYPQLTADLKKLGVKIIPINEPQKPDELFALILDLGTKTGNAAHAEQLVARLKAQDFNLHLAHTDTLMLSDTGVVEGYFPQYPALLNLLGLTPLKTPLTAKNFSLEKMLLAEPNVLIEITDKQSYNEQAELLDHPLLRKHFKNFPRFTLPMKYTYCFDHGVWQGAEMIYNQDKGDKN